MSRLRNQLNRALRTIRPWAARIEIGPEMLVELRKEAAAWRFEKGEDQSWKYRGVPIRIRPRLRGWRVVGESSIAAAAALNRLSSGKASPLQGPLTIDSDDFNDVEALRMERARSRQAAAEM